MKRRLLLPLWYRLFLSWGVIVIAYIAVPASFRLPAGWSQVALAGCAVVVVAGLAVTMRLGVEARRGDTRWGRKRPSRRRGEGIRCGT